MTCSCMTTTDLKDSMLGYRAATELLDEYVLLNQTGDSFYDSGPEVAAANGRNPRLLGAMHLKR